MSLLKRLFSSSVKFCGLADLENDIHSHFLPGIDDGCKTIEESINLLSQYSEIGIKRVVCTPHIMKEFYPNTAATIKEVFDKLQEALKKRNINIELHYAAEYLIDGYFESLIEKDEILHFGKNKFVLTELSHYTPYPKYRNIIESLQNKGYTVILAHPERYSYWHFNLDTLKDLHRNGVLMQVNLPSLAAYYGNTVKKQAIKLIEKGLIDLAAGDIHNNRHLNAIINVQKDINFCKALKYNIFKNKLLF